MPDEDIDGMVSRMTAKDMLRLGKLEKTKFAERVMSGSQQCNTETDEHQRSSDVKYFDTNSIYNERGNT